MLVIWDVSEARSASGGATAAKAVKIVAKAHTEVHVSRVQFLRYDSARLVSCGRENVRFWRLKDDSLRSCAVNLSHYIQTVNRGSESIWVRSDESNLKIKIGIIIVTSGTFT